MENVNYGRINQNHTQMMTIAIIALVIAVIAVTLATSITYVTIIRLQEQEDKFADIEKRLDNISEAGRLQDGRIRNIEQYINKKK